MELRESGYLTRLLWQITNSKNDRMEAKTMKSKYTWMKRSLIGWVALVLAVPLLQAETWFRYQARPGSKVTIEGTSTVHDWSVEGGIISGFMELESNFPLNSASAVPESAKLNAKVEVVIPVRALKSGQTLMDEVMLGAMNEEKFKQIRYKLESISLKPRNEGKALQFEANGVLTISGVSKPNSMLVSIEKVSDTRLKVTGETPLKMTDFGIKPPAPSIGLGLIKTGDDVKVVFEWITALRK